MDLPAHLPTSFLPKPGAPVSAAGVAQDGAIIDLFRFKEFFAAVSAGPGGAFAQFTPGPDPLPRGVLTTLQSHCARAPIRTIEASRLFLFPFHAIEAAPDEPGIDDPLRLVGTLSGPFPSSEPVTLSGRLAVARSEFVDAALVGAGEPIRLASPSGEASHYSLLFSVDSGDPTPTCVLAYPASPGARGRGPGNESDFAGLLYDVLRDVQGDLRREGTVNPIATRVLPPPMGAPIAAPVKRAGWLRRLFGAVRHPPPGTLEDYLAVADLVREELFRTPPSRVERARRMTVAGTDPALTARARRSVVTAALPGSGVWECEELLFKGPRLGTSLHEVAVNPATRTRPAGQHAASLDFEIKAAAKTDLWVWQALKTGTTRHRPFLTVPAGGAWVPLSCPLVTASGPWNPYEAPITLSLRSGGDFRIRRLTFVHGPIVEPKQAATRRKKR